MSSETLDRIYKLYIQDIQPLVGFSVIPKCMILNYRDSNFTLNAGYRISVKYLLRYCKFHCSCDRILLYNKIQNVLHAMCFMFYCSCKRGLKLLLQVSIKHKTVLLQFG